MFIPFIQRTTPSFFGWLKTCVFQITTPFGTRIMAPAKKARCGSLDEGDEHPAENSGVQPSDAASAQDEVSEGDLSGSERDCQELSDSGGEVHETVAGQVVANADDSPLLVVERGIADQVVTRTVEESGCEMVGSAESDGQVVTGVSGSLEAQIAPQEERKSRLMIKHIILENFKSYGGRKMIGPFHKSFSSIVGPNGSGKSNTIDALLFVFGKRAKKMRLNKVSELIHKSLHLQNCGSAKVEVVFQDIYDTGDGSEDYEIVENSELSVAREAFKNNQSKYYMDG